MRKKITPARLKKMNKKIDEMIDNLPPFQHLSNLSEKELQEIHKDATHYIKHEEMHLKKYNKEHSSNIDFSAYMTAKGYLEENNLEDKDLSGIVKLASQYLVYSKKIFDKVDKECERALNAYKKKYPNAETRSFGLIYHSDNDLNYGSFDTFVKKKETVGERHGRRKKEAI